MANRKIDNVVNGTFIPSTTKNIQYSCGLKDNAIDNLAQGSVAIARNRTFNRKCWRCNHSYIEKGLTHDTTCPHCSQKSNNPEFIEMLHNNSHMNIAFKFSGLAKDSPPMSASTFVPRTFNHEDIYHNAKSNRVASGSSSGNVYKQKQQSINKLNRILQFSGVSK